VVSLHLLQDRESISGQTRRSTVKKDTAGLYDASAFLCSALLPLDIRNLGELEIGRVGGEQTRSRGVGGRQANLRVDVERAARAARRPDGGDAVRLIVLQVVAVGGTLEGVLGGALRTTSALFIICT